MRKAHIMGIEGVGMSALARLLMAEGVAVTGCDLAPGPRARRLGVPVHHGHDPGHLADEDTLVVPTPVPPDHPEVVEARKRGLRVLRRIELLAHFLAQRPSAGVTGTHGKTTTTGMLAAILLEAGLDPWVFLLVSGTGAGTGICASIWVSQRVLSWHGNRQQLRSTQVDRK